MNSKVSEWINAKNIVVFLFGIFVMYAVTNTAVNSRVSALESDLRTQIADQQVLLAAIAEAASRNGADEVTEKIIKDCGIGDRVQFDNLLGKLDKGLTNAQLIELERLFGRCGSFFSDRKAVMVAKLSREIQIYENYIIQFNSIVGEDQSVDFNLDLWKMLSEQEQKQSDLFTELVDLQDQIIVTLLSGKTASSDEINEILQRVSQVNQSLAVATIQTKETKSKLLSL